MPTEKSRAAQGQKGKEPRILVLPAFVYPYSARLSEQLSVFGAEVAQQLRREEALNKQALLTSLKTT